MTKLLIALNANLHEFDPMGNMAVEVALDEGYPEIADLINAVLRRIAYLNKPGQRESSRTQTKKCN